MTSYKLGLTASLAARLIGLWLAGLCHHDAQIS